MCTVDVPLGPVAVFAASNFPFAFGVPGGDTASALAAGCPVVVKGHPAQPRLSRRIAEILGAAVAGAGAPEGTFGFLDAESTDGDPNKLSIELVRHPAIKAVGFTGSLRRRPGADGRRGRAAGADPGVRGDGEREPGVRAARARSPTRRAGRSGRRRWPGR